MIGSKRRTVGLLNMLEEEGFSRADLNRIHTPIGLDIGALTVKEIAISIVAELIAERRRTTDRRSKSSILTAEDIDLPLLRYVADESIDKVLLLVYDTSGSTPVKSGSFMAVDSSTKFMGTIGGGCSESAVLRQAYYLIGTGESRSVSIDMSNDVAEKEGMVCGGQMKVLLADLSRDKKKTNDTGLSRSIVRLFLLYSGMGTLCVCPFSVQCTSLSCTNRPVQRRPLRAERPRAHPASADTGCCSSPRQRGCSGVAEYRSRPSRHSPDGHNS